MYVLIADSGSTKTDWVLCKGTEVLKRVKTAGLNPYFQTAEEICSELSDKLKPALSDLASDINSVHYYGTGCSTAANCTLLEKCLNDVINVSSVTVSHDLLAAARALCGYQPGIAAILGTGSNSCLYDGAKIIENVPSTGYLWSDYGGGSQIGKYFIRDYFEGRLPDDIAGDFEAAGYNREVILDNVYKGSVPSRYLASVSLFAGRYAETPAVRKILTECFDSFFDQQISKYEVSSDFPIHIVGSVGFFYRKIIREIASRHDFRCGNILQSPIDGLLEYHSVQR